MSKGKGKDKLGKPKKTEGKTEPAKGVLVVPSHGRGLINRGAPANPVAGPGRPKDRVRAALRKAGANRIQVLRDIADQADARPADRIKAIDTMLRYGLGVEHPISMDEIRSRLRATIALIRRELPAEAAEPLLSQMGEIWS